MCCGSRLRHARLTQSRQIANEVDGAPESWLIWAGLWKLLFGKTAHANWHFTDPAREPLSKLTLFIARSENPAWFEVVGYQLEESPLRPIMRLIALAYEFEAWTELPHTLRDLVLLAPRLLVAFVRFILRRPAAESEGVDDDDDEGSEVSAGSAARRDRLRKRLCASAGFLGIYFVWAIFSWFIFVRAFVSLQHARLALSMQRIPCFLQTYGSLIYKQLGPGAEQSFSSQWGVGYAMDNCTEWQEVAKTAVKAALILVRALT